jgi:succinate dehydrogenase / fumarate reductase flavoprotein subunit
MEFYQFHPTGLYKLGILLSEAARGEGGILRNGRGEAFAERYAPTLKDLAPRDLVSRFIYQEVKEGRGVNGEDYVHLDVSHLPPEVIDAKLPDITDFARTYLGVEPKTDPVPIQPTAHYAMGGLPTDIEGRVIRDAANTVIPGFYSAGESACVSVHGANRLGTNSLVDLVVFGRRAGRHMLGFIAETELPPLPPRPGAGRPRPGCRPPRAAEGGAGRRAAGSDARGDDGQGLGRPRRGRDDEAKGESTTAPRLRQRAIDDQARLQHRPTEASSWAACIDCAEAIVDGALGREESRGAHYRDDFPETRRRQLAGPHPGLPHLRRPGAAQEAGHDHRVRAEGAEV